MVKDGVHINIASSDTIREKFKSYKKAAEFMKSNPNKYSAEDVARLYLYPDGNQHLTPETEPDDWKPSEWLPKGWMGCPVKKESEKEISKWKKRSIKIKSPEGERFNSYSKATMHMREHPTRYSEEDIRKHCVETRPHTGEVVAEWCETRGSGDIIQHVNCSFPSDDSIAALGKKTITI